MKKTLTTLVKQLAQPALSRTDVIPWSCPVPSFGNISRSVVATLGLNPSNREFVDQNGTELTGKCRRLQTLSSLGLRCWSEAADDHLNMIKKSCFSYFSKNPYDGWFRAMEHIISGVDASYYEGETRACHLDLIPFATSIKWTELSQKQRTLLLSLTSETLGVLLRDSKIRLLILNGKSVVENLEKVAGIVLDREEKPSWTLPRYSRPGVRGFAYRGHIHELAGINLNRSVLVLGYNHNIQSSFGVTNKVKKSIRSWLSTAAKEVMK